MEKFCNKCGEELVNGDVLEYSTSTGEPIHSKVCPSGKCGHIGIPHNLVKVSGFWEEILHSRSSYKCADCGIEKYIDHFDIW